MENERNPWDVLEEENIANAEKTAAKRRRAAIKKSASAWFLGIVKWVLLISLGLFLIFEIFIHPINKLKLRLFLGGSCEIIATAYTPLQSVVLGSLKVDGNIIYKNGTYYEVDGKTVYQYEMGRNEWVKTEMEGQLLIFGDPDDKVIHLEDFLDRRNYEWAKEKFFTYRLKDDADVNWKGEVEFRRLPGGQYELKLSVGGVPVTIVFKNIGKVKLDRPWQES
jgi:hypothetical protein